MQLPRHLESRVADVDAIEKRDHVQDQQERHDPPVNAAHRASGEGIVDGKCHLRRVRSKTSPTYGPTKPFQPEIARRRWLRRSANRHPPAKPALVSQPDKAPRIPELTPRHRRWPERR